MHLRFFSPSYCFAWATTSWPCSHISKSSRAGLLLAVYHKKAPQGSWLTIAHSKSWAHCSSLVVLILPLPSLHSDQHLFWEACSRTHPRAEKEGEIDSDIELRQSVSPSLCTLYVSNDFCVSTSVGSSDFLRRRGLSNFFFASAMLIAERWNDMLNIFLLFFFIWWDSSRSDNGFKK